MAAVNMQHYVEKKNVIFVFLFCLY